MPGLHDLHRLCTTLDSTKRVRLGRYRGRGCHLDRFRTYSSRLRCARGWTWGAVPSSIAQAQSPAARSCEWSIKRPAPSIAKAVDSGQTLQSRLTSGILMTYAELDCWNRHIHACRLPLEMRHVSFPFPHHQKATTDHALPYLQRCCCSNRPRQHRRSACWLSACKWLLLGILHQRLHRLPEPGKPISSPPTLLAWNYSLTTNSRASAGKPSLRSTSSPKSYSCFSQSNSRGTFRCLAKRKS